MDNTSPSTRERGSSNASFQNKGEFRNVNTTLAVEAV